MTDAEYIRMRGEENQQPARLRVRRSWPRWLTRLHRQGRSSEAVGSSGRPLSKTKAC